MAEEKKVQELCDEEASQVAGGLRTADMRDRIPAADRALETEQRSRVDLRADVSGGILDDSEKKGIEKFFFDIGKFFSGLFK